MGSAATTEIVSVVPGLPTGGLALVAFGLDSVINGSASAVLVAAFASSCAGPGVVRAAAAERRASRVVAVAMLGAAC